MNENFSQLLEESLSKIEMRPGAIVRGKVIHISPDYVTVTAGLKSEGIIPIEQFYNEEQRLEVNVGDEVDLALDAVEDGFGETRLSREKAKRSEAWTQLAKYHEDGALVRGIVSGKVKGGFTVEIGSIRAFLPGSLVDIRPTRDPKIENQEIEFKVIKLDQKRNNVVVSRRAVIESESSAERSALLGNIQEGQEVKGIVKNLTDYGAFVDLGGVDGLLHITDMSWKRVKHPSEIVNVGDEIRVKVLKFDRERSRVSLGLKQLGDDPWNDLARRYPKGARLVGKVTNITDYGCFVEIENGVEGLVHVSEMDWTNKNINPNKIVHLGQEVTVTVLEIDEERRRISLGIKQGVSNPWTAFSETHNKSDKISGKIKSITDFGIFIGLDGGIDGLVHLSDISWTEPGEEAVRKYKKGDEVEAVVLAVDPERERISLGIKQLAEDALSHFIANNPKGSLVKGHVKEIEAKKAVIDLGNGIEGQLKSSDFSKEKVEDLQQHLKVGEELELKFMGIERKSRALILSARKEKEVSNDDLDLSEYKPEAPVTTTLGDLLKEKLDKQ